MQAMIVSDMIASRVLIVFIVMYISIEIVFTIAFSMDLKVFID